jgi:hypothetical protein
LGMAGKVNLTNVLKGEIGEISRARQSHGWWPKRTHC